MDPIYRQLTNIFHELFDDDSIVLQPELTANDIAEWDSLMHIRIIIAVERAFGVKLAAAQTANLKNVGELADLIRTKTAA